MGKKGIETYIAIKAAFPSTVVLFAKASNLHEKLGYSIFSNSDPPKQLCTQLGMLMLMAPASGSTH